MKKWRMTLGSDKTNAILRRYFREKVCPLCESNQSQFLYPIDKNYAVLHSGIDLSDVPVGVVGCRKCGHQFIQPVPQPEFLRAFYSSYMSKAKEGFYRESYQAEIPDSFRLHYGRWLEHIIDIAQRKGTILDVGAGLGMFLRLALEYGFEVTGIEPNQEAADFLNKRYGISVHNSLLEDVNVSERYDVVTMWDLLEHLPDPKEAIKKVYRLIKPGGLLVLETPARDSFIHWLVKAVFRTSLGHIKRPLFLVYGIHHLQYFSAKSLCKFLNESRFKVIDVLRYETDINKLLRTAGTVPLSKTKSYNAVIITSFILARIFRKQNKLVIFAKKIDRKDGN